MPQDLWPIEKKYFDRVSGITHEIICFIPYSDDLCYESGIFISKYQIKILYKNSEIKIQNWNSGIHPFFSKIIILWGLIGTSRCRCILPNTSGFLTQSLYRLFHTRQPSNKQYKRKQLSWNTEHTNSPAGRSQMQLKMAEFSLIFPGRSVDRISLLSGRCFCIYLYLCNTFKGFNT